ncbi:hypothetical protein GQX74_008504 [Glossina fuscipes]|nr:hypothetical protein GQX74_008504 [Glossina fuscipes]
MAIVNVDIVVVVVVVVVIGRWLYYCCFIHNVIERANNICKQTHTCLQSGDAYKALERNPTCIPLVRGENSSLKMGVIGPAHQRQGRTLNPIMYWPLRKSLMTFYVSFLLKKESVLHASKKEAQSINLAHWQHHRLNLHRYGLLT